MNLLKLSEMSFLLGSYSVLKVSQLSQEVVLLVLSLSGVKLLLFRDLSSILISQRGQLSDELTLLFLEGSCMALLKVSKELSMSIFLR